MNKRLLLLLILVGGILAGSLVLLLSGMLHTPEQRIVEVVQGGSVLYTFDLNTAENQSVRIDTEDSYNIVTIENGEIFMSEAGCPDHTCVRMGILRAENLPIVCLPNQLVIRFA